MAAKLRSASLVESVHFNRLVIVPNAVQGIFRRRPAAVALATKLNIDGRAVGLLRSLRKSHGQGPLWIRVMTHETLLLLSAKDVRRVLEGAPSPFAADPEAKRK